MNIIARLLHWLVGVETAPSWPACRPRPYMLTPCDHCGHAEGELVAYGVWHADGDDEGEVIDHEHYVLCRHCREQADAAVRSVLEGRCVVRG